MSFQRVARLPYLWLFKVEMQRSGQMTGHITCLICKPKRPFDVIIHFSALELKPLDVRCWFLWQIQELPREEPHLLTVRLIALVLFKLFLVEQMQDWTKLKIHWNWGYIFYISVNRVDLEELQANILYVWRYSTGLCIDTGTLCQCLILLTTDANTSTWCL